MIDKKEVKHIARLARLGLSEKELDKMQKDFSGILDYIETLKEVDISSIDDVFSKEGLTNVVREDIAEKKDYKEKLLELAPERKGDYIKSKKIL